MVAEWKSNYVSGIRKLPGDVLASGRGWTGAFEHARVGFSAAEEVKLQLSARGKGGELHPKPLKRGREASAV